MGAMQTRTTRWMVCAGPGQYLDIAGRLVASGCASAVEWDTVPARALARLSQMPEASVGVIVGEGCHGQPPLDLAASAANARGSATTVLCVRRVAELDEAARERGVSACVAPDGLLGLLAGLCADWEASEGEAGASESRPRSPAPRPVPCVRPVGRPGRAGVGVITRDDEETHAWSPAGVGIDMPPVSGEPDPEFDLDLDEPGEQLAPTPGAHPVPAPSRVPDVGAPSLPLAHVPSGSPGGEARPADAKAEPAVVANETGFGGVELPGGEGDLVPTICLASARGGVGKSTLAVLMALAMAREGLRVALVDLDYQFGTCLGFLGLDETDGLPEPRDGKPLVLDGRMLDRCRARGGDGLLAYEFCRLPERAELLAPLSSGLVRAARQGCDVALVDLPAGMTEGVAQAFELADRCLVVGDQRALSLESMAAAVALSTRLGVPRTKLLAVLNRCDPRHRDEGFLSRARFELQVPQIMRVVDGGTEVTRMLELGCAGELVSMRNRCALSSADLAAALCADLGCVPGAQAVAQQRPPARLPAPPSVGLLARRHRAHRAEPREELVPCL